MYVFLIGIAATHFSKRLENAQYFRLREMTACFLHQLQGHQPRRFSRLPFGAIKVDTIKVDDCGTTSTR